MRPLRGESDGRESVRAPLTDEAAVQAAACVARCNFSPPCAGLPYLCLNLVRHGEKLPRPPRPWSGRRRREFTFKKGRGNEPDSGSECSSSSRTICRKYREAGRNAPPTAQCGTPRRNQPMLILIPVSLAGPVTRPLYGMVGLSAP